VKKQQIRKDMNIIVNGESRKVRAGSRGGFYVKYNGAKNRKYSSWSLENRQNHDKKSITLTFIRHETYGQFQTHYSNFTVRNQDQGWYILGTTKNVGYVGIVGDKYKRRQARNATFVTRWESHNQEGKKFPKRFMAGKSVKIKTNIARLHTCSVSVAKNRSTRMPPLNQRGLRQVSLIKSVEAIIVSALAKKNHDKKKKPTSFYKKSGKRWLGGKLNPTPVDFTGSKTLINDKLLGPPSKLIYSGEFNVKLRGTLPNNVSDEFQNGVYAKSLMDD